MASPRSKSSPIVSARASASPSVTTRQRLVRRWQSERGFQPARDELAVEEPLEIQVDTRSVVVTMRTPGHDPELAAGFLLTEGILHRSADIAKIQLHPRNRTGNVLQVFLAPGVAVDFARLTRHVFASSSCGLCGKASIESVHHEFPRLPPKKSAMFTTATLTEAAEKLQERQTTFARTGGLHAAAIFDQAGEFLVVREDVGRHNAVDKAIGYGLLHDHLPYARHALLVSGRASFEILQKALAARIPVVAAVSAPSSLAVEFAQASRITLVGFLRPGRLNVYTHSQRITA